MDFKSKGNKTPKITYFEVWSIMRLKKPVDEFLSSELLPGFCFAILTSADFFVDLSIRSSLTYTNDAEAMMIMVMTTR